MNTDEKDTEISVPQISYLSSVIEARDAEIVRLKARVEEFEPLVMAVGNKYPGESRIETALRYIRQAERLDDMQPQQESKQ